MKQKSDKTKTTLRNVRNPAVSPSAGTNGIALLPPAYGIDAIDRGTPDFHPDPASPAAAAVQAKLTVGPANSAFEREADRVAARVMNSGTLDPGQVARNSSGEQKGQAKSIRRLTSSRGLEPNETIQQRLESQKGSGSPLPAKARTFMESRFAADFSGVRLHTGGDAAQLSQELNAQAFTRGKDIFMGAGKYDPASRAGQKLLAHELTHVIQQSAAQPQEKSRGEGALIQRALRFDNTSWKEAKRNQVGQRHGSSRP